MARFARAVAPGQPHHVTQRGNRRQPTFFCDEDYEAYRSLLAHSCRVAGVDIWAYCLMPNHVHLILTPDTEAGLSTALSECHRRYTRHINQREGWTGFLWQGRFASAPMDERYLMACALYVEMNPVRARLVEKPEAWPWSSARPHLTGRSDGVVDPAPLLERPGDWADFLAQALPQAEYEAIRRSETLGRPLGEPAFVDRLEQELGRPLKPKQVGRKRLVKE